MRRLGAGGDHTFDCGGPRRIAGHGNGRMNVQVSVIKSAPVMLRIEMAVRRARRMATDGPHQRAVFPHVGSDNELRAQLTTGRRRHDTGDAAVHEPPPLARHRAAQVWNGATGADGRTQAPLVDRNNLSFWYGSRYCGK